MSGRRAGLGRLGPGACLASTQGYLFAITKPVPRSAPFVVSFFSSPVESTRHRFACCSFLHCFIRAIANSESKRSVSRRRSRASTIVGDSQRRTSSATSFRGHRRAATHPSRPSSRSSIGEVMGFEHAELQPRSLCSLFARIPRLHHID